MQVTFDACHVQITEKKVFWKYQGYTVTPFHIMAFKYLFLSSTVQYAAFINTNKNVWAEPCVLHL